MKTITIVDPPSGWMYGFPKVFTFKPQLLEMCLCEDSYKEEYLNQLSKWFIENGYPKEEVDMALKYSRYWEENMSTYGKDRFDRIFNKFHTTRTTKDCKINADDLAWLLYWSSIGLKQRPCYFEEPNRTAEI